MKMPYTKSGKCGQTVWQRNRFGQISYPAFIPFNPRSPAQIAVRGAFSAVSKRWRTLSQDQRDTWIAAARTKWSKTRLRQRGRLPGFNFFMKTNVALANRGMAQVDLPPGHTQVPQLAGSSPFNTNRFGQLPVGPILFLQANQLLHCWQDNPQEVLAGHPT